MEERNDAEYTTYLFNGKELDEETGLYYYGARYYEPRVSVFYGIDPMIEKKIGFSPYIFCSNRPVIKIDADVRDDYYIKKNGEIDVKRNNSKQNNYYIYRRFWFDKKVATLDVEKNKTVTYGKNTAIKDMVQLRGFDSNFLKTKQVESGNTYLDENVAAALIGASYFFESQTGKKVLLNQLGNLSGGHSKHQGMGDRIDFQYIRKDGSEGPTYANQNSFDPDDNLKLVQSLKTFKFSRFYSQASNGSNLPGTTFEVDHYHHLHADFNNQTRTVNER